jgi:hypothetical protein
MWANFIQETGWNVCLRSLSPSRCQFHQHLRARFFVQNFGDKAKMQLEKLPWRTFIGKNALKNVDENDCRYQFHQRFTCVFFIRTSFWQLFLHTCNYKSCRSDIRMKNACKKSLMKLAKGNNWYDASEACKQLGSGGRLPEIRSVSENDDILGMQVNLQIMLCMEYNQGTFNFFRTEFTS